VEHDVVFTVFGWRYSNNTTRLYIDGILEAEENIIEHVDPGVGQVYLGRTASNQFPYHGTLRDPKFYLMAMNAREIGGDVDGDGIENVDDNCPLVPNGPAESGIFGVGNQIDFDADGAGDACDPDDDGDGLLDTAETDTGIYVDEADTGTDPYNIDSDGDGFDDGDEVHAGSDPNDFNSTPEGYTNRDAFLAQLAGLAGIVDFDSLLAGAILNSTTVSVVGPQIGYSVQFPAAVADVLTPGGSPPIDLKVVEDTGNNPTASSTQSLGTDDSENFDAIVSGTDLQFSFAQPLQAFGLHLVTPDEPNVALFDFDAQLSAPGMPTIKLDVDDSVLVDTVNGIEYRAYFLGIAGQPDLPFSTATLSYGPSTPDGSFLFNIDDIIAVPEPARLMLLVAGLAGLSALPRSGSRRRRATTPRPAAREAP